LERTKATAIFHKHICFLCRRGYEEVEAGNCQHVADHLWGKCPQCEENFGVKSQSSDGDRPRPSSSS
jgi:hypothetical protein